VRRALGSIAAGETWIEGGTILNEDGSLQWGAGLFVTSFVIVVNWTLLQVSVAVI